MLIATRGARRRCGSSCARCARSRRRLDWHATVWSPRPLARAGDARPGRCASGSTFVDASDCSRDEALAAADVAGARLRGRSGRSRGRSCARSPAGRRAGRLAPARRTRSCSPTASTGSMFEPGDAQTLAAHLARLIAEPERLRREPGAGASVCRRRSRGRASPTSSRTSTASSSRAGTTTRGDRPAARAA